MRKKTNVGILRNSRRNRKMLRVPRGYRPLNGEPSQSALFPAFYPPREDAVAASSSSAVNIAGNKGDGTSSAMYETNDGLAADGIDDDDDGQEGLERPKLLFRRRRLRRRRAVGEGKDSSQRTSDDICGCCGGVSLTSIKRIALALLLALVATAIATALALSDRVSVYSVNQVWAAECAENICRFGFTDYPTAKPCHSSADCKRYFDPCSSNPCHGRGTRACRVTSKGDYVCVCRSGYGGRSCGIRLHPCDHENPCHGPTSTCRKDERGEKGDEQEESGEEKSFRYTCYCGVGWLGKNCRYRSTMGDTCAHDTHCGKAGGKCLDVGGAIGGGSPKRCACPMKRHGHHCEKTLDVDDCLALPCGDGGACMELEEGFHCHCRGHLAGRTCQHVLGTGKRENGRAGYCPFRCKNGGSCDKNLEGVFRCFCQPGYGGVDCNVLDVSRQRNARLTLGSRGGDGGAVGRNGFDGEWTGMCRGVVGPQTFGSGIGGANVDVSSATIPSSSRILPSPSPLPLPFDFRGRWFLISVATNPFNPPDECPQVSIEEDRAKLQEVAAVAGDRIDKDDKNWGSETRGSGGWLAVEYTALRNDTSSHYKVEKGVVDEVKTAMRVVGQKDPDDYHNSSFPFFVEMTGTMVRDYSFPVEKLETFDRLVVTYRLLVLSGSKDRREEDEEVALYTCLTEETHGLVESVFLLSRKLKSVSSRMSTTEAVERAFPRLRGRMVDLQRYNSCDERGGGD